jgi:hypothetical protein
MRGYAPPTLFTGEYMKLIKGSYKIITQHGWKLKEGTVGYDYPFYIFREEGHTAKHDWCVSHISSGYSIRTNISLKHARQIVKALKPFPLFLLPDGESIANEQKRMTKHKLIQIQNIVNQKEMP